MEYLGSPSVDDSHIVFFEADSIGNKAIIFAIAICVKAFGI